MLHWVDALFLAAIAVVQPVQGGISYRRYVAQAKHGFVMPCRRLYLETQLLEWTLMAALAVMWMALGRDWAGLGFVPAGGAGFWASAGFAVVCTAYLCYAWHASRGLDNAERARQWQALGDLRYFSPRSRQDYRHFAAVSLTAGLVEETIYRGYLFWLLMPIMPTWAVVLVSSLIFAVGHSYQGVNGMLRVFGVGLCLGLLYAVSGSIWIPIVLHAVLDLLQGAVLLTYADHHDDPSQEAA